MTHASVTRLSRALRRLEQSQGRIARRNARRLVLVELRLVRTAMNRDYPAIKRPQRVRVAVVEPLALRDARRLTWRRWEWKYLNPGAAVWSRPEAQAFVDFYAASIGQPSKPIVFDFPDKSRLLGEHRTDRIRLASHTSSALDVRTKSGRRSVDWHKWRTLLHEVAHYQAQGHDAPFKRELLEVFQSWKRWRSQRYGLAAAAKAVQS